MFGGQNPKNTYIGGRNRHFKPNLQNFQMGPYFGLQATKETSRVAQGY